MTVFAIMIHVMKDSIAKIAQKGTVSGHYYIIVALVYMSTLIIPGMRPGVLSAALMILVVLELALSKSFVIKTMPDVIATAFFAYEALSVIWLLAGGFPISVFAEEFVVSALPMIFYFVGRSICNKDADRWFRNFIIAIMILGIAGVILYAAAPQFYNDWLFAWSYTSKPDAATTRVRMHSVIGSTCLSFLSVAGILASAHFLSGSLSDKKKNRILSVICMALCLLFSIMANQRSGLVAAAIVIVYINVLVFFVLDMFPRKYFIIEVAIVAAVFAAVCAIRFDFILKYWYRIESLPSAISQRSEQWVAAVNNMYSSWLGNGLGANGHKALGLEDAHVVADGGLVKLYCENGVLGFSLWLFLVITALKRGISNIASSYAPLGIVVIALLQSIGSNILAFQICAPVFWFALGMLGRDKITVDN